MKKILSLLALLMLTVTAAWADDFYRLAGQEVLFGSDWDGTDTNNNMTQDGSIYKWEKTGVTLSSNVEFKVVKNGVDWIPEGFGNNYVLSISTGKKYDVTITYDPSNKTVNATATESITKVEIRGSFNGWAEPTDGLVMQKQSGTNNYVATLDLTDINNDVQFKLVLNNKVYWLGYDNLSRNAPDGWIEESTSDGNVLLKNGSTGYKTYTVTATWTPTADATTGWSLTIEGKDERPAVYYAAGVEALWGVNWTIDESNKLTEDGEGNYTITKDNIELSAGNYGYKVVKVVGEVQTWIPDPGDAKLLSIEEAGIYSVTLTLDPTELLSSESYNAVATWTSDIYTVYGAFYDGEGEHASILGTAWNPTITANDMVKGEGNVYTKTYSNVDLTPGNFQLKVGKNHSGDINYPDGANYQLNIAAAGMYDIEVTFNADSKVVSATATPVEDAYTVVGDEDLTGYDWQIKEANHMTLNTTSGYYEWTANDIIVSETVQPEFKVWKKDDTWYPSGYNNNWKITLTAIGAKVAGKYNIKITFDASNNGIGVTATKTHEAITISNEKGWATTVTNSALDFSAQTFKAYTATLDGTTVTLAEASDVPAETGLVLKGGPDTYYVPVIESSSKGKGSLSGSSTESYTVGSEDNYDCFGLTIKGENAQFVKINNGVVIPAKKAFLKTAPNLARELIVMFEGETTGIETVNAEQATLKGEMYNLAGQKVNNDFKGIVINNGKKVMMK